MDSDWGACDYPVITGHEIVGTVAEVGKDVKHIKVGDRVGVGAMVNTQSSSNKPTHMHLTCARCEERVHESNSCTSGSSRVLIRRVL